MNTPTLQQLAARTEQLFADEGAFCPALDWVEEILPVFVASCRRAVQENAEEALEWWSAWAFEDGIQDLESAGKGAIFAWRQHWIRLLLNTSLTLIQTEGGCKPEMRRVLAFELANTHSYMPDCFAAGFWQALVDYIALDRDAASTSAEGPVVPNIAFPLLLSEPVVLAGQDTPLLLAQFQLERLSGQTGQVFLHPEQAPLFCMDAAFGAAFTRAATLMRAYCPTEKGLADVRVRIQTLEPGQERFLQGQQLRGVSASGALALGLHTLHGQKMPLASPLAASFALCNPDTGQVDGGCYPVGGATEKVRGCALQGIRRLIVADPQQRELALYGRRHGIEVLGVKTFAEAVQALESASGASLLSVPASPVESPSEEEESRGAVPLASRYYVTRGEDGRFHAALAQRPMIVLVKGARQMGKSSLLVRGVEQSRSLGAQVVWTDIQKCNAEDLLSPQAFYTALANMLTRQLRLKASLAETWNPNDSPNMNFEYFLLDHVLAQTAAPITWFLDEADRLFATRFYSEVFGLMRSWHNDRSVVPAWSKLTLVLSYAAETHLFIKDAYQSPFNVGTRLELADFTLEQVAELNDRYDRPLSDGAALTRFFHLVGGHPYLVRRGLSWMTREKAGIGAFAANAYKDSGPLGDYLHRLLPALTDTEQGNALRGILKGKPCPSAALFYQLRSSGILAGDTVQEARLRCQVYAAYLERHLL